ncbi:MAG: MFS transporter [Candidimonas sp.]|nr:MAG: MFS transporter [Candidimonas sp.]
MGVTAKADEADTLSPEPARAAHRLRLSLDRSKFTRRHLAMYLTIALGHFMDGFDILMIGLVLPGAAASFGLAPADKGVLASSVFTGMLIGTIIVGPIADRIGRKPVLITAVIAYCLLSLAAAFTTSYHELLAVRVLQGIGLGAEVPIVFTYLSEFMPTERRGFMLASSVFFWQASTFVAAFIAILVVPHYTWRGMFVVAAIPAIVLIFLWSHLPESVRFLINKGRTEEAEKVVRRISTVNPDSITEAPPTTRPPEPARFRDLISGHYTRPTLGIWLWQFAGGGITVALVVWMPSLFLKMGFPVVKSFAYTGLIAGAGALGDMAGGWFIDRVGRRLGITAFYLIGGVMMFVWGAATNSTLVLIFGALTAFFGSGHGGPLFAYCSEIYPTRFRTAGTGWSAAFQRIGAIVIPSFLGVLLGAGASHYIFFAVMGVILLVGGVGGYLLSFETRGKSLEEITDHLAR